MTPPTGQGPLGPSSDQAVGLPDASSRQGSRLLFHLVPECSDSPVATSDSMSQPLPDFDQDRSTFTVDTTGFELGTHVIHFDCSGGLTAQANLLIFRQNGAERGEANSIVLAGGIGLASTAAVVGLPTVGSPRPGRRRRRVP